MQASSPIPSALVDTLRQARSVVVLTGAGISAESGVPTFRAAQTGLWSQYDPEELATREAFTRNPQLVWDWYAWRRGLVKAASPNDGHYALVTIEQHVPEFAIITQNVDNLHQEAGSRRVFELHGNIARCKCTLCDFSGTEWPESTPGPPRCPHCGTGRLRPDVVWFGESLPSAVLDAAMDAAKRADLLLSVGTSALVYPAAHIPFLAVRAHIPTVEINPESTPFSSYATYCLREPAGTALPALVGAAWPD